MRTDVRGKTVLMVLRRSEAADPSRCTAPGLFAATTSCRECRAECTIAPASIERLRKEPEIVVLCVQCGMRAHAINPFDHFEPVSVPEVIEALRKRRGL